MRKRSVKTKLIISIIITLYLILIIGNSIKSESQIWENEYGKLEVYPKKCFSPINNFTQYYNVTWYYPENNLDFAFSFNESLISGGVYIEDGDNDYHKVETNHIVYDNKDFYVVDNVHFNQSETKHGYINYRSQNNTGKWHLHIKLDSDTWEYAFNNDRIISLDPWFDANWSYKIPIHINSSYVYMNVSNFPVYLNFTYTNLSNAQTDGDDICFIHENESFQFNHEIDYFDYANNTLRVWVNLTNVSDIEDTLFYMYFGNPLCANQEHITDTWNNNFRCVHHFTGNDETELLDSTSNNNDISSEHGNPVYNETMIIGNGVTFDGDDYLVIDDDSTLSFPSGQKFCIIVVANVTEDGLYLGKWGTQYEYQLAINENRIRCGLYSNVGRYRKAYTPITSTGLNFYTVRYDGSNADLEDGVEIYVNTTRDIPYVDSGGSANGYMEDKTGNLGIFADYDGDNPIEGQIDELFMIGGSLVPYQWIETFYFNLNNSYDGGFFYLGNYTYSLPCECLLTNFSMTPNSVNVNTSINLTVDVVSVCGIMDYVNLSLFSNSKDFLQYHNVTMGENGTYYLNLSGLSYLTNYTWYINASCNSTHNHTLMYFTTRSGYGEIDYDLIESIINDALNKYNAITENDIMDSMYIIIFLCIMLLSILPLIIKKGFTVGFIFSIVGIDMCFFITDHSLFNALALNLVYTCQMLVFPFILLFNGIYLAYTREFLKVIWTDEEIKEKLDRLHSRLFKEEK